ncbi:hypothetical protein AB0E01_37930 [Nocardia vinacea]|uniref:hypothetical protein n=1 Tax=Nocardia vinacea TaxID=96468 RepID=UPI0034086393
MASGCVAATVVGGAVLLIIWWRARPPAPDLVLAAVLLALVTSRVLSPQYLVWAVAVASVCALDSRSTQRPVLLLVLATALMSQVEFPFVYDRVATGSWSGVGGADGPQRHAALRDYVVDRSTVPQRSRSSELTARPTRSWISVR